MNIRPHATRASLHRGSTSADTTASTHALSGAYALDALDEVERAMFEQHLTGCEPCQLEVASFTETTAHLSLLAGGSTTAQQAPVVSEGLRASILDSIAAVRPLPPTQEAAAEPIDLTAQRARRRGPWLLGAAAAVVFLGASSTLTAVITDSLDDAGQQMSAETLTDIDPTIRVLEADDAKRAVHKLPGGGTATVVTSQALDQVVVVTKNLPEPGEGLVYELWLSHDDTMTPAGFVPAGPNNAVLLSGNVSEADAIGLTIEPVGGSTTPTLSTAAILAL